MGRRAGVNSGRMDRRLYWMGLWLLTAAVGGAVGGMTAVAVIGIDPHPFRSVSAPAKQAPEESCLRYGLDGKRLGPC